MPKLNQAFGQTSWGGRIDPRLMLELEEKSEARSLALTHAARSIVDATELVHRRRLEEFSTLRDRESYHDDESNPYREEDEKRQSLALARAARKTLLAEKKLASKCIREAKLRLQASYDLAETVENKLVLAERRIGAIMADMTASGLIITLPCPPASKPCLWPPHELGLDNSDSDGSDTEMDVMAALESDDEDVDVGDSDIDIDAGNVTVPP